MHEPLWEEWQTDEGRTYYYNTTTEHSQWDRPNKGEIVQKLDETSEDHFQQRRDVPVDLNDAEVDQLREREQEGVLKVRELRRELELVINNQQEQEQIIRRQVAEIEQLREATTALKNENRALVLEASDERILRQEQAKTELEKREKIMRIMRQPNEQMERQVLDAQVGAERAQARVREKDMLIEQLNRDVEHLKKAMQMEREAADQKLQERMNLMRSAVEAVSDREANAIRSVEKLKLELRLQARTHQVSDALDSLSVTRAHNGSSIEEPHQAKVAAAARRASEEATASMRWELGEVKRALKVQVERCGCLQRELERLQSFPAALLQLVQWSTQLPQPHEQEQEQEQDQEQPGLRPMTPAGSGSSGDEDAARTNAAGDAGEFAEEREGVLTAGMGGHAMVTFVIRRLGAYARLMKSRDDEAVTEIDELEAELQKAQGEKRETTRNCAVLVKKLQQLQLQLQQAAQRRQHESPHVPHSRSQWGGGHAESFSMHSQTTSAHRYRNGAGGGFVNGSSKSDGSNIQSSKSNTNTNTNSSSSIGSVSSTSSASAPPMTSRSAVAASSPRKLSFKGAGMDGTAAAAPFPSMQ